MNQLMLIGFLGKDPEVRFTAQGAKITSFSIACGKAENTFWVKCNAFGDSHDKMIGYLKKGSLICVNGELKKPRIYQDKQGASQTSLEITINSLYFVPSKSTEKVAQELSIKDDLPF